MKSLRSTLIVMVVFSSFAMLFSLSLAPATLAEDSLSHATPFDFITYAYTPKVSVTAPDESANFHLTIRPHKDKIHRVMVKISGENISIEGDPSISIEFAGAMLDVAVPIHYRVDSNGSGVVTIDMISYGSEGQILASNFSQIFYNATENAVFHSTNGSLETELMELDWLWWNDYLSEQEYLDARDRVLGAGAIENNTISVGVQSSDAGFQALSDLQISGTILWTDINGNTHPVRSARVEIRDDEFISSELVTAINTDGNGNYFAIVDNDDGFLQGGRDIFVRVMAQSAGIQVQTAGGTIHRIESSIFDDVADGSNLSINLIANNTADNNTAFSVLDGFVMIRPYAEYLSGNAPGLIPIHFPNGTGAFYRSSEGFINLPRGDRFDWDVMHHEYGHYVMDIYNMENSPGGPHNIADNQSEERGNKSEGIRLAWSEGWPTYFGTAGQQWANAASFNIPRVGDISYSDFERTNDEGDDTSFSYSLESDSRSNGEDQELAVQMFMWDLYDTASDGGDTVSYNDVTLFSLLNNADPVTFSQAYAAIIAGRPIAEVIQIGCVATDHKMAPQPTMPANNALLNGVTRAASWNNNGGGNTNKNNSFVVEFYNNDYSMMLHSSPTVTTANSSVTTASYNIPQSVWDTFGALQAPVRWIVKGTQTNSPTTGPYTSCSNVFEVDNTPPTTMADVAGIMGNDNWWISPVTVTLNASDTQSGVFRTYYKINSGNEEVYTGSLFFNIDGIYNIEYRSEDNLGNLEDWKSIEVKVDTTDPVTDYLINGTPGLNGWWVSDLTVDLIPSDNLSGVANTVYRIDGGAEQNYIDVIPFNDDGIFILEFRSTDVAGNVEDWNVLELKIDTVPPFIDISTDQDVYTRVELIVIDIVAFDPEPGSGIWKIIADFDGQPVVDGTVIDPFWFDLGIYEYTATAQDFAGWTSSDNGSIELIATIDSLGPTVERLCDEGHISNQGICNALLAKINAARNSVGRGNNRPAINQLNALLHQILAQQGKSLSVDAFRLLNQDVRYVITHMGGVPKPAALGEEVEVATPDPIMAPPVVESPAPVVATPEVSEVVIVAPEATEEAIVPSEETVAASVPLEETDDVVTPPEETVIDPPTVDETPEPLATDTPVVPVAIEGIEPPTVTDLNELVLTCITNKGLQSALLNHIANEQWDLVVDKLNKQATGNINTSCETSVHIDMLNMAIYLHDN